MSVPVVRPVHPPKGDRSSLPACLGVYGPSHQAWQVYEEGEGHQAESGRKLRALQVAVTLFAKSAWGKTEMRRRLEDM